MRVAQSCGYSDTNAVLRAGYEKESVETKAAPVVLAVAREAVAETRAVDSTKSWTGVDEVSCNKISAISLSPRDASTACGDLKLSYSRVVPRKCTNNNPIPANNLRWGARHDLHVPQRRRCRWRW